MMTVKRVLVVGGLAVAVAVPAGMAVAAAASPSPGSGAGPGSGAQQHHLRMWAQMAGRTPPS